MVQIIAVLDIIFGVTFINLLIIGIIVGIIEKINERKPVYYDPDRRVYFAKNHSAGFNFIVRFLTFGATIVYLPQFVLVFIFVYTADHTELDFPVVAVIMLVGFMISLFIAILLFVLSCKIKLISKVDRVEVANDGLRIIYRKKNLRESAYPIEHFRGYEGKKHELIFADRVGNNSHIDTSYLGRKYSAALGNDLIALRTGKHLNKVPVTEPAMKTYISDMNIKQADIDLSIRDVSDNTEDESVKNIFKESEKDKPLFSNEDSSILSEYGSLKTDTSDSILSSFGSSVLGSNSGLLSGTEEHIKEAAKGTIATEEPEKREEVMTKAPAGDMPALSTASRIFIKNTYLTDIEKKIASSGQTAFKTSASHYSGSSWMYVELIADGNEDSLDIFNSAMNLMKSLSDLSKDIFFYSESDDTVAYIMDGKDIHCRKAGKSYIFNSDTLNLEPCEDTELTDADTKTYIKRKFYLDV